MTREDFRIIGGVIVATVVCGIAAVIGWHLIVPLLHVAGGLGVVLIVGGVIALGCLWVRVYNAVLRAMGDQHGV